jgi:predicted AAA+ superfamily ATPase
VTSKDFYLGCAAGLSFAAVGLATSAFTLVGTGLVLGGSMGLVAWGVEKYEQRYNNLFEGCGLKKNDCYPLIIKETKDFLLLSLPAGLSVADVAKKSESFSSYFKKPVAVEKTSDGKALVRVLGASEGDKWYKLFLACGIVSNGSPAPKLEKQESTSVGKRFVFALPSGMTLADFEKAKHSLEVALEKKIQLWEQDFKLVIETLEVDFKEFYSVDFAKALLPGMTFLLGVCRDGRPLTLDLGGNEFSTLVCGASGSGKSVFLNTLLVQFVLKGVDLVAIDLKGVEFNLFKHYKGMKRYAITIADATEALKFAYEEMTRRYKVLGDNDCKDYNSYNKTHKDKLNPLLVVIDEFSVLANDKKAKFYLFELLSRSRASNILLVVCTQTPRANVLEGVIRCNIKNTVCFACETDTDSEVALGQKGNYRAARELTHAGRGFLKSGGKFVEFQGYYLSDKEIKETVKPMLKTKKELEQEKPKQAIESIEPPSLDAFLEKMKNL